MMARIVAAAFGMTWSRWRRGRGAFLADNDASNARPTAETTFTVGERAALPGAPCELRRDGWPCAGVPIDPIPCRMAA